MVFFGLGWWVGERRSLRALIFVAFAFYGSVESGICVFDLLMEAAISLAMTITTTKVTIDNKNNKDDDDDDDDSDSEDDGMVSIVCSRRV